MTERRTIRHGMCKQIIPGLESSPRGTVGIIKKIIKAFRDGFSLLGLVSERQ